MGQVRNRFSPIEPLSDDQIEAMHRTSLRVLDGETRSILKDAGAGTDEASQTVYMEPDLVEQAVVVTPFTLRGTMAPATVALVQQNAEALFGFALIQIVNPGAPGAYGRFTCNVDMKTAAPVFGTPECALACQATGQLTRRYRVPCRSSNTNASNALDAQAAYESMMSLWGAIMGHANFVFHSAGWLEGSLVGSFEKLAIDAGMLPDDGGVSRGRQARR